MQSFPFSDVGKQQLFEPALSVHGGGIKLPHLSRKSIEVIANRIIAAYKRLPSLQGQNPDMIQPEFLVHDLLGLTTEYHTLSRDGGILGLLRLC